MLRRLGDLFLLQWAEFEGAFPAVAAADWTAAAAAIETAIEINRAAVIRTPPPGTWPITAGWPACAAA